MKLHIFPNGKIIGTEIEKMNLWPSLIVGSTVGLKKTENEDKVGVLTDQTRTLICLADGHWGKAAAELAAQHWLAARGVFPRSRAQAVAATTELESKLCSLFQTPQLDLTTDFTPETAFVACELRQDQLKIVSYGDCRLIVIRQGKVLFSLPEVKTWLGIFSQLGLRGRQSVKEALIFKTLTLKPDDLVFVFSDGVDECIYEQPTISHEFFLGLSQLRQPKQIFDRLMAEVVHHGAEDNASLVVFRFFK